MTPTEQIHLETATLENQIADLINAFERRTGVAVERVEIVDFSFAHRRMYGQPLNIEVMVGLPPPPAKPKQV
jgi:hypothetical protein